MNQAEVSLNLFEVKQIISQFSGQSNIIGCPAVFKKWLGNFNTSILLSQILYWSERTSNPDGWFYKKYTDWDDEISLTADEARGATNKLKRLKIIETKVEKVYGTPVLHYRLNTEQFYLQFSKFLTIQNKEVQKTHLQMGERPNGSGRKPISEVGENPSPLSSQEITTRDYKQEITNTHTQTGGKWENPISEKKERVCVSENSDSEIWEFIETKIIHIPPLQYQDWTKLVKYFSKNGLGVKKFAVFWKWFRENPDFKKFKNYRVKPENMLNYLPVWVESLERKDDASSDNNSPAETTKQRIAREIREAESSVFGET